MLIQNVWYVNLNKRVILVSGLFSLWGYSAPLKLTHFSSLIDISKYYIRYVKSIVPYDVVSKDNVFIKSHYNAG